jgi:hypothetical protein
MVDHFCLYKRRVFLAKLLFYPHSLSWKKLLYVLFLTHNKNKYKIKLINL